MGPATPEAGVIATKPATAPVAAPTAVGLPETIVSTASQANTAAAVAIWVTNIAMPAEPLASTALPALKPNQPTQSMAASLRSELSRLREEPAATKPTALIFMGFSDSMGIREVTGSLAIDVPGDLSVVILGHPDVPTEHLGFFTMVGGGHRAGAEALLKTVRNRINDAKLPPQITYLDCVMKVGASTARYAGA